MCLVLIKKLIFNLITLVFHSYTSTILIKEKYGIHFDIV